MQIRDEIRNGYFYAEGSDEVMLEGERSRG
jgi:hypothetical protein